MKKNRILIVENDPIYALEIESSLISLGYEITSIAETGEDAIEKARNDKPDVILMDLGIKGSIGWIAATEIIQSMFDIPVIYSASYLNEKKLSQAKFKMPFGFVLKPIQKRELKVTLEMALYVSADDEERIRTEKALEESQRKYKTILENIEDGYYEVDLNGDFTFINDSMSRIFGVNKDEMKGLNFRNFTDKVNENIILEISDRLSKNKETKVMFDIEISDNEGTKRHLELSASLMKDPKDSYLGFYGIVRDVTAKRKTEQLLKESEELYRTLFERSSDAIFMIDAKTGKYINANRAAERLTGYSLAEIQTKTTNDLSPVGANERLTAVTSLETNKEFGEVIYLRTDGTMRHTTLTAVRINEEQIVGIAHDITERKQSEDLLSKAHDDLESKVELRTAELEKTNNALTILLRRSDQDKTELEEKILSNIKELIMPSLKRLEKGQLNSKQLNLLTTIEDNLNKITSPFSRILSSNCSTLTPKEIQIANLIKDGKSSKEIADAIDSTKNTVEFHRRNLRKKLGLKNKKKNLRTHLLSLH